MITEASQSLDVVEKQLRSELARASAYRAGELLRYDVYELLSGCHHLIKNPNLGLEKTRAVGRRLCELSREMQFMGDVEKLSAGFRTNLARVCHVCADLLPDVDDPTVQEYMRLLRSRSY